jgi:hypothetical protein
VRDRGGRRERRKEGRKENGKKKKKRRGERDEKGERDGEIRAAIAEPVGHTQCRVRADEATGKRSGVGNRALGTERD